MTKGQWKTVSLEEVADLNPRLPEKPAPTDLVAFVPMASVSAETASVTSEETRSYAEVAKGYTAFLSGDVLLAKITPCFENGKIAQALLSKRVGFGSTEFHVIRPHADKLDGRYTHHFLRLDSVRLAGERRMTGSGGQRRVPENYLANLAIPLPPLAEQRRIAEVLDRAEGLRAKRRAALAQLDALTQSLFLDLFGDPKSNPKAWPQKAMTELFAASPIFGSMIPPVSEKCGWLSLRVGNIQNWTLDLNDSKYVELPFGSIERHSVKDGDLLMARAIASQDHLGKCIIAHPKGAQWAFDSHLMRLRFDHNRTEPEFIRHLFMTPGGRALFLKASRKSTVQFNINTKEISSLQIPVPPIPLQREFARRVTAVEALKTAQRASLAGLDALFATLQHRAFRGEL
jgi:type I restriction enzyme S subunit